MLLKFKLAETQRFIDLSIAQCRNVLTTAYPSLQSRLQLILKELDQYKQQADQLSYHIAQYQTVKSTGIDTWPQLYEKLAEISLAIHAFRTQELPAYLVSRVEDVYCASLITALHKEVGLNNVDAVVALHQSQWFAVMPYFPNYPLYLMPNSIVEDLAELPLIFHEIGHVLFRLWNNNFTQPFFFVIANTAARRRKEASQITDPKLRGEIEAALVNLEQMMSYQIEELVCDIVGTLIGGPAFSLSLANGLWLMGDPFAGNWKYPSLDYRVQIARLVLNHAGFEGELKILIDDAWSRVVGLNTMPVAYQWIYGSDYLDEMVKTVGDQLKLQGLSLYQDNPSGIRLTLNIGVQELLKSEMDYRNWMTDSINTLKTQFYPSQQ